MKMRILWGIFKDEAGQGMVEYALVITGISLVSLLNMRLIGTWLNAAMGSITMAM